MLLFLSFYLNFSYCKKKKKTTHLMYMLLLNYILKYYWRIICAYVGLAVLLCNTTSCPKSTHLTTKGGDKGLHTGTGRNTLDISASPLMQMWNLARSRQDSDVLVEKKSKNKGICSGELVNYLATHSSVISQWKDFWGLPHAV